MRFLLFALTSSLLIISCQTTPASDQAALVKNQDLYKMPFIRVALDQAEKPSPYWEPKQRDCAGFVRFVYRNALNTKDPLWQDWQGQKVHYANADLLVSKNFTRIGNKVNESVHTGDILVFRREDQKKEDQWHLMLLMESPWDQNRWLVTYHNGSQDDKGGVKKVWLKDLLTTDQAQWKPVRENKNFVGVYRWNKWLN